MAQRYSIRPHYRLLEELQAGHPEWQFEAASKQEEGKTPQEQALTYLLEREAGRVL